MPPDINECERQPPPCAHTCSNTLGSFRCHCPPGRHLLGDAQSCAGLEWLPSYESYESLLYGYRASQASPDRLYHNLASQSFHSHAVQQRGPAPRRPRRASGVWSPAGRASGVWGPAGRASRVRGPADRASSAQGPARCPQGFEPKAGHCLGNAEGPQRMSSRYGLLLNAQ